MVMKDSFALMGEGVGLKIGILMRSIFELRKFIGCQEKARRILSRQGISSSLLLWFLR